MKTMIKILSLAFCLVICLCLMPDASADSEIVFPSAVDLLDSGSCGANGSNVRWQIDSAGTLSFIGTGAIRDYYLFDDAGTTRGNTPWYNYKIRSVVFSEGITKTGNYLLFNPVDFDVSSITLPTTIIEIGKGSFSWNSLGNINFPVGLQKIGEYAFESTELQRVILPETLTSLGAGAFMYCSKLNELQLPNSITEIQHSTFWADRALTNFSIPNSITKTGRGAFLGCYTSSITIPESLTEIGSVTFAEISTLKTVTILGNNKTISPDAFNYCSNIESMYFDGQDMTITGRVGASNPIIYCREYSDVDTWATEQGYTTIYLDNINTEDIRTISLPNAIRIASGKEQTIIPVVFPNCDYTGIEWSVSDETIVSVENGVLIASLPGNATVTASIGNTSAEMDVTVYAPISDYSLSCNEKWMIAKESLQLSICDILPETAEGQFIWRSSDESIAKVNEQGFVTTYKPGEVIISATSDNDISRECALYVCYPVSAVSFDKEKEIVNIGNQLQLIANVTMRTQTCENHLVSFSSDHPETVSVDQNGIVTAHKHGIAVISAMSENGVSSSIQVEAHLFNILQEVQPTCSDTGLGEGIDCSDCGNTLVVQEIIPALGHEWGDPVYTWAEDNRTVTATRKCKRDENHIDFETVNAYRRVTVVPTQTEVGEYEWVSHEFENSVFSSQKTVGDTIPAFKDMSILQLPAALKTIESEAFVGISTEAIIIPDRCATIEPEAFVNCTNLLYIRIPAGVEISSDAFTGCPSVSIDQQ